MMTRVAAALSDQEVESVGRDQQSLETRSARRPSSPAQCILRGLCEKRSQGFLSEPPLLWSHSWFLTEHRASRLQLRAWTRGDLAQVLSELLLLHV